MNAFLRKQFFFETVGPHHTNKKSTVLPTLLPRRSFVPELPGLSRLPHVPTTVDTIPHIPDLTLPDPDELEQLPLDPPVRLDRPVPVISMPPDRPDELDLVPVQGPVPVRLRLEVVEPRKRRRQRRPLRLGRAGTAGEVAVRVGEPDRRREEGVDECAA